LKDKRPGFDWGAGNSDPAIFTKSLFNYLFNWGIPLQICY